MKHIFIDFEMHPVAKEYKEERKICSREVIEFGAVMLDDCYTEIGSFKQYVKPQYVNDVYSKISVLTGITKNMLIGAQSFAKVLKDFVSWSGAGNEDVTIYAWSNSDLEQFRKEIELKCIPTTSEIEGIMNNWVDFQKDYCELVHAERLLSLDNALNSIGQLFLGNMHDALYDARNTAELFTVSRDTNEFLRVLKPITEVINGKREERSTFTLGDIFNFDLCNVALA